MAKSQLEIVLLDEGPAAKGGSDAPAEMPGPVPSKASGPPADSSRGGQPSTPAESSERKQPVESPTDRKAAESTGKLLEFSARMIGLGPLIDAFKTASGLLKDVALGLRGTDRVVPPSPQTAGPPAEKATDAEVLPPTDRPAAKAPTPERASGPKPEETPAPDTSAKSIGDEVGKAVSDIPIEPSTHTKETTERFESKQQRDSERQTDRSVKTERDSKSDRVTDRTEKLSEKVTTEKPAPLDEMSQRFAAAKERLAKLGAKPAEALTPGIPTVPKVTGATGVAGPAARTAGGAAAGAAGGGGVATGAAAGAAGGAAGSAGVGGAIAAAAANPVTIGLAAMAAALVVTTVVAKKLSDTFHAAAERVEDFSPDVAQAMAQNEARRDFAQLRRADRIGPQLAQAENTRGKVEDAMTDLWTEILGVLLTFFNKFEPVIDTGISIVEAAGAGIALSNEWLEVIAAASQFEWDKAREEYKDIEAAKAKFNKELLEIFSGEDEKEDPTQPLLDLLQNAAASLPPRRARGRGI